MQKFVKDYLNELTRRKKRRREAAIAVMLLAVLVIGGVAGILERYGVAMTGRAKCGLEEHKHSEACYEEILICGQEEGKSHVHGDACYTVETALSCGQEEGGGHTHGDECYETEDTSVLTCGQEEGEEHTHGDECYETESTSVLTCGQEEGGGHTHEDSCYTETKVLTCGEEEVSHTHSEACYEEQLTCEKEEHEHNDSCYTAGQSEARPEDIEEDPDQWEEQYAEVHWKDAWGEDLVTAAKKQLGYEEKVVILEDGSEKTYTRYGHFADDKYLENWDAAFVNFCMHYAGLEEAGVFADETDTEEWPSEFEKTREENKDYLTSKEGYTPATGDLVFLQEDGEEEQMGIVSSYNNETGEVEVIQGNSDGKVEENTYDKADDAIDSYLKISELEEDCKEEDSETGEEPAGEEEGITPEQQVESVIALIEALPTPEEVAERFTALADAEDEEGYDAYYLELYQQVLEAKKAYDSLSEEQKQAVVNAEKLMQFEWLWTDMMVESVWGEMGPDEAYVNEIKISSIKTGAAPFDETEGQGNDTTADDMRVRTFDTVTYQFSADMKSWDSSKSYSQARVKLEFVLPLTEQEAVFDQTAMAWMDQTEGYQPELKTEKRTIDGVEKDCQVLTCYKLLLPSSGNQSVVPGNFGENVTINVRAMKNGETFAPIFSATMEGGTWDGTCEKEEHKIDGEPAVEKQTVTAEPVEITAAPRYNVCILGDSTYKNNFDFQGDADWMAQYGNVAANTDISTPVPGCMIKLGVTLQLYNDNESKGLKGIELPTGDITFDLQVSSSYHINMPAEGSDYKQEDRIDTSGDYRPLLWSYGPNDWKEYGSQNTDGRVLYDQLGCAPFAPYSTGGGRNSCYNSGTWNATQNRNDGTIHITVSGYEINPDKMPVISGDESNQKYGANVGCFSAGAIWIVQPFNTITGENHGAEPNFDVVNTYGQGSFTTNVKDVNLIATTVSGARVEHQMITNDDDRNYTLELTLGGALQNRIRYASATNPGQGSGIEDSRNGCDYAAVGSELYLMGCFSYNARGEENNQLYLGTNLTKFYGSAIELIEGDWFPDLVNGAKLDGKTGDAARQNIRIRYATKPDGKDWTSDKELLETYEEDLVFYKSLKDIPEGHVCVGILYTLIGPGAPVDANDPYYYCYHKARVRDNMDLAGQAFMLASTSRVWTKGMYEQDHHTLDRIPDWTEESTNLWSFPAHDWHYTSANIDGSTWYKKETYKPDGSGIYGTHNSDWSHWGDTLLVIGYKTKVSKFLLQKDNNGQDKKTFNLDADQRVADYKLEPGTYYDQPGTFGNTTTVTIVDTLPKYMTYKPGSAYFGGTYEQSSANGGTQGRIVKDTSPDAKFPEPKLTEPTVVSNPDGTQTLTWTLTDVKIGDPLAPIYYSVDIGTKGNPDEDVPIGTTNLENQVYISAPGDLRDPMTTGEKHSEAGIAVTRGSASSFGKYTKQKVVDEDGAIDYVVYYNNNAETTTSLTIMDTMPVNGENGSHFTGTYTFDQWQLDMTKCKPEKITIYYTFDTTYKNKTTKEVKREEIETWKKASIEEDGKITIPTEADGATEEQPYPIAWAVVGALDPGQSVSIDLRIQLNPGASDTDKKENNYFVNRLSSGDTTTTTETPTVRRTLEGLAWMDYNRDGLQDDPETEVRISGVKVELLRLRDGENPENESSYEPVYYPSTDPGNPGNPVVIETGQQISLRAEDGSKAVAYETGRYKFTDLPAGIYAVRFTDGSGETKITELNATSVDSGENDTRDSDAIASRDETGRLLKTTILNLEMPKAEDMNVSLFESRFHDSGFYPDTRMKLQKVGENGEALSGAIFTIQDESGTTLSFIYDEARGYTPYDEEGEASRKGKYYIALASNPYYVVGINGTQDGALPVLQNRTGNANQLFEMRQEGEQLYSFLNMASGKWLDLDGGNLQNGAKIHVWSNTAPNENQKWYVTDWDSGSYISPYLGKDAWSLDLNGANAQENQKIHLYSRNNTPAQKWVLIPAGITSETRTDLNVNSTEGVIINNLKPGNYTISEIKSPTGHSLLKQPVSFTVKGDGSIETSGSMGQVGEEDGKSIVLQIRNERLYELPKTGGSGTFVYTISGTLLMLAATLILYKKKSYKNQA